MLLQKMGASKYDLDQTPISSLNRGNVSDQVNNTCTAAKITTLIVKCGIKKCIPISNSCFKREQTFMKREELKGYLYYNCIYH